MNSTYTSSNTFPLSAIGAEGYTHELTSNGWSMEHDNGCIITMTFQNATIVINRRTNMVKYTQYWG